MVEATPAKSTTAPFGAWTSTIAAAEVARSATFLSDIRVAHGKVYWSERRPADAGRHVVVTPNAAGDIEDLIAPGFSARTRVHEYGGAAYVVHGEMLYFSNWSDQRLYRSKSGASPLALTPVGYRYADCVTDLAGSWLYCVREDHTKEGEPKNSLVVVPAGGGHAGMELFGRSDFVAYPRLSVDGRRLAWIAWNHPNMPWDTTTLYVAALEGEELANVQVVAGGKLESVVEPSWDSDGSLYFISDRSGWCNLYRWSDGRVETVLPLAAELASPLWALGQANYALTGDGRAVVRHVVDGSDHLGLVDLERGTLQRFVLPFTSISSVQLRDANTALFIGATAHDLPAVVALDLTGGRYRTLRHASDLRIAPETVSVAEPLQFATTGSATAHALFYEPRNPAFAPAAGERPPLLVRVHGGPTSHVSPTLDLTIQYWTSRGFAVLDLNYRGSSGYGRAYRQALNGQWGIVDVDDAVAAAQYLSLQGRIDPSRVAIRGNSAGGFTALAALAFRDVFKAGANYYGVSDLEALARDTHKFESHYLETLVAPLPEGIATYRARSPLHHLDGFTEPLITFQGSEDEIVPPHQSRLIVTALKERGVPVAYLELEGEQHGFRKAESTARVIEAELYFYGKVFGFTPADRLEPVAIEGGGPAV